MLLSCCRLRNQLVSRCLGQDLIKGIGRPAAVPRRLTMKEFLSLKAWTLTIVALTLAISVSSRFSAQTKSKGGKIFAQKLVEDGLAKHPEITGLEIAATPPGKHCMTIAATEAKEIAG